MPEPRVLTAAARRVAVRALTGGGNGLAGGEGAPVSVTRRADLQCRCSGGIRAFGGRRRLMITCPLPSPLDLGRTSKFAILSSVSSSTRQMTSSTAPSQSGNVRKLSPDPHPRCPATTPRSLSTRAPAVRSLTALHPPPPPRPAASHSRAFTPGLHPPTCQMSRCSTGRASRQTQCQTECRGEGGQGGGGERGGKSACAEGGPEGKR